MPFDCQQNESLPLLINKVCALFRFRPCAKFLEIVQNSHPITDTKGLLAYSDQDISSESITNAKIFCVVLTVD